MGQFQKVAKAADVHAGKVRCADVAGKKVALFSLDGQIYALRDLCTHEEAPLSEGRVDGEEIECPWHFARFNIKTGEVTCPPASDPVERYNVRVTDGDVEVEI